MIAHVGGLPVEEVLPAQMKRLADPGRNPTAELGVAGFKPDGSANAARPDRLQHDVEASSQ